MNWLIFGPGECIGNIPSWIHLPSPCAFTGFKWWFCWHHVICYGLMVSRIWKLETMRFYVSRCWALVLTFLIFLCFIRLFIHCSSACSEYRVTHVFSSSSMYYVLQKVAYLISINILSDLVSKDSVGKYTQNPHVKLVFTKASTLQNKAHGIFFRAHKMCYLSRKNLHDSHP